MRLVEAALARNDRREALHALGLLAHRAELLLEGDLLELGQVGLERLLQVLLVEELGVVETGANHTLVAVDHGVGDGRVGVGNHHEGAREPAVLVVGGEVALVGEHRVADDLVGHGEELLVEVAHEYRRPLAKVHDLVEDLPGRVDADAQLGLDLGDALADDLLSALGRKHVCGLERGHVGGGLSDDVLARTQHTVAARDVAARDVGKAHGHNVRSEQAADPAHRAHEGLVHGAPALASVVGPLERGDDAPGKRREDGLGWLRGDVALGEDILAAVGVRAAYEFGGTHATLAGEALGGLGGIAVGIEGDLGGGAAQYLVHLVGGGSHGVDEHGQAARARHDADLAVGQAGLLEA